MIESTTIYDNAWPNHRFQYCLGPLSDNYYSTEPYITRPYILFDYLKSKGFQYGEVAVSTSPERTVVCLSRPLPANILVELKLKFG